MERLPIFILAITLSIDLAVIFADAETPPTVCTAANGNGNGVKVLGNITLDMSWGQVMAYDLSVDRKTLYMLLVNSTDIDNEQGTMVALDLEDNAKLKVIGHKSWEFPHKDSPVIDAFGFYVLNQTHLVYCYSNEPEPVTVSLVDLSSLSISRTMYRMGVASYLPIASIATKSLFFTPELGYNYARVFDIDTWSIEGINNTMPGVEYVMGANFFPVLPLNPPKFAAPTTRDDFVSMPVTGQESWEIQQKVHDDLLDYVNQPYSIDWKDGVLSKLFFCFSDIDNSKSFAFGEGAVWYDPNTLKRQNIVSLNLEAGEDLLNAAAGGGRGWIVGPCRSVAGDFIQTIPLEMDVTAKDVKSMYLPNRNPADSMIGLSNGNVIMIDSGESASFGHRPASLQVYGV